MRTGSKSRRASKRRRVRHGRSNKPPTSGHRRTVARAIGLAVAVVLAAVLSTNLGASDLTAEASKPAADLERGAELYASKCASCHGKSGGGDGPTARHLQPKPTDFSSGHFKIRSTAQGAAPTDHDLYRTLTFGVPGTAMIAWSGLSVEDRWQLVHYVKHLASISGEAAPIELPEPTPVTAEAVQEGKRLYSLLGCVQCHGTDGFGDGPAAKTLVDYADRPIYPRDLTRSQQFKGGAGSRDIYRTLHTGLDGTPMPSYAEVLSEADSWALAHFVASLRIDAPKPEVVATLNSETADARLRTTATRLAAAQAEAGELRERLAASEARAEEAVALAGEAQAQADETADRLAVEEARKAELERNRKARAKRRAEERERRRLAAEKAKTSSDALPTTPPRQESRLADARSFFKTRCAACHGTYGRGDGPAAPGLNPRPRDLSDSAWKGDANKQRVLDVIVKGGPGVGLSPLMPAFPDLQSDPGLLAALVTYVWEL